MNIAGRARGARAPSTGTPGGVPSEGAVLILATCSAGTMRWREIVDALTLQRKDLAVAWPPPNGPWRHAAGDGARPSRMRASTGLFRQGRAVAMVLGKPARHGSGNRCTGRAVAMVRRCGVPVVPVDLRPDKGMHQGVGRTAHRPARARVESGSRISVGELMGIPGEAREAYLRLISDALRLAPRAPPRLRELATLLPPPPRERLAHEIAALPPECTLLRRGPFQVCMARAEDAPTVLAEIARLRELSFRLAGEGSGKPCDTDRFDAHYDHLFIWHPDSREIAGAYRLALADEVARVHGIAGLYTSTLFDYGDALLRHLGSAIELGRSFVAPSWQRSFQPLMLLWAGLVALLDKRCPQVRHLFGPASISATYGSTARAVMARALLDRSAGTELSRLVRARAPASWPEGVDCPRHVAAALADPVRLSQAVKHMAHGTGLPVLVRRYLELNGRFACFGIDESFGGTLDGLVFVDVQQIPAALLSRLRSLGTDPAPATRGEAC